MIGLKWAAVLSGVAVLLIGLLAQGSSSATDHIGGKLICSYSLVMLALTFWATGWVAKLAQWALVLPMLILIAYGIWRQL